MAKSTSAAQTHIPSHRPGPAGRHLAPAAPLPGAVRRRMEAGLGADFSTVRVQESPRAPAVGALAFTRGEQVTFAPGRYDPSSRAGLRVLGHELAHVVQQREGRVRATGRAGGEPVNADPALEREAHALGRRAAEGGAAGPKPPLPPAAQGTAAGVIQRHTACYIPNMDGPLGTNDGGFLIEANRSFNSAQVNHVYNQVPGAAKMQLNAVPLLGQIDGFPNHQTQTFQGIDGTGAGGPMHLPRQKDVNPSLTPPVSG
jgi:hypothetical protein